MSSFYRPVVEQRVDVREVAHGGCFTSVRTREHYFAHLSPCLAALDEQGEAWRSNVQWAR